MRVKALQDSTGGIQAGLIYEVTEKDGNWLLVNGSCWYSPLHPRFPEYFEIIEDEPEPKVLTGKVETKEEIEERLGASGRDPLALSVKEIMELQEAYHAVIKSTAQLVEINKMLLPRMDKAIFLITQGAGTDAVTELALIRQFVEAGSHS